MFRSSKESSIFKKGEKYLRFQILQKYAGSNYESLVLYEIEVLDVCVYTVLYFKGSINQKHKKMLQINVHNQFIHEFLLLKYKFFQRVY